MGDFFGTQSDYVYFFYGLGFLFLSIICFHIRKDRRYGLPWVLLGMFGLFHGLNEWGEIFKISYEIDIVFSIIHLVILGISFLFLFEFARVGFIRGSRLDLDPAIYLVVFVLALYGLRQGIAGLNVSLRYFLGLPAGLFAAWVIYHRSRSDKAAGRPLVFLSVTLAFYALRCCSQSDETC